LHALFVILVLGRSLILVIGNQRILPLTQLAASAPSAPAAPKAFGIIRNVLSILGSDIAIRASSFALYALIARYLGERALGQMSLAQATFYFLGYSLAGLGIRWFLARELAKHPERTERYLGSGILMVLLTSTLVIIGILVVATVSGYSDDTRTAIILMSLTIYPYTLMMVSEGTFIGREKMQYIFLVNAPMSILNIIATFVLLNNGASIFHVIGVQIASYCIIALIQWSLMLRFVARPSFVNRLGGVRELVKAAAGFYGIDVVVALLSTMQLYLISLVADESRVGLYSSASQLYVPILLVMTSIVGSMLPVLTRQVEPGLQRMKATANNLIELLLMISVPAVVGVFFVASDLLVFAYGRDSYAAGGIFLQIISINLVLRSFIHILGNMLYATRNESQNLRIVTIHSVLSLIANVIAIVRWGPLGAAVVAVVLELLAYVMHAFAVRRTLNIGFSPIPLLWRTVFASLVMGAALYFLPTSLNVLLRIIIGAAVYAVALGVILVTTVGGPAQIRKKYLSRGGGEMPMTVGVVPLAEGD
jgi:O-antigen/teichoic acid export membrane protein